MRRFSFLLASFLLGVPMLALALPPVVLNSFKIHDFDKSITQILGYQSATIIYYKEIASLTAAQSEAMSKYEPVGCYPFYVVRNGVIEESGYNCRSFFCVGYLRGPKVCKDRDGEPYGGVVEIGGRLSIMPQDQRKFFSEYLPADRSVYMTRRQAELGAVRCRPFYLLRFDIAVGEGYQCDEIGQYPYFSSAFSCLDDWREESDFVCTATVHDDELEQRKAILQRRGEYVAATGALVTAATSFPDVLQGYYGYTAITDLARRGIVSGYPDGTFKPGKNLNRAELSKLLVSALRPQEVRSESFCFPDVKDEWFAPFVCAAKRLGWLSGYPDGFFRPEQTMQKAEGMKVVIAAATKDLSSAASLPRGVSDGQWYSPYVRKAVGIGVLLEASFLPAADVTRADAAVWIYRALKYLSLTGQQTASEESE